LKINARAGVLGNNYTHTLAHIVHPACKSAGVKNYTALLLSSKAAASIYLFARMSILGAHAGGKIAPPAASKHLLLLSESGLVYHFHTALQPAGIIIPSSITHTCAARTKSPLYQHLGRTLDGYGYSEAHRWIYQFKGLEMELFVGLPRGKQITSLLYLNAVHLQTSGGKVEAIYLKFIKLNNVFVPV
jgi:hypothetical protein